MKSGRVRREIGSCPQDGESHGLCQQIVISLNGSRFGVVGEAEKEHELLTEREEFRSHIFTGRRHSLATSK